MTEVNEPLKGAKIPKGLEEKLNRGREVMRKDSSLRRLCRLFEQGRQYFYLGLGNVLLEQSTVTVRGGKPPHRIRNKYNFIHAIVEAKVSAATQRVPGYEVTPASSEPEDANAALLAQKVAVWGYDRWGLRRATVKAVKNAVVTGEAFAYPYFDPNVGPFTRQLNPLTGKVETVGQGEIKVAILSGDEVFWEPGCDFEDSRWCAVERSMVPADVEAMDGFYGGKLTPDATAMGDSTTDRENARKVLVTEYLERPSKDEPQGRRVFIANGKVICPVEPYPCRDKHGRAVDEPALHRLSYIVDPGQDRDRGLVEQLIDLQRTINDCFSKLIEWKNRCLNPQILAPVGSLITPPDDVPGATRYYEPFGEHVPTWEKPPAIPRELFDMIEMSIMHMRSIGADIDVQASPDLAARTAQAAIEQGQQRWQSFIVDLAQWHAEVMHHCLYLVQQNYSSERQLQIMGDYGVDPVDGFTGADLRGQADVRVAPGTIEVRSRQRVVQEALMFADRGWITPQQAMAVIHGGIGEKLYETYLRDINWAGHIIQKIKQGPEAVFAMRPNPDGSPGWMPRPFDDVNVWLAVFTDWLKTPEWDRLPDEMREVANLVYEGLVQQKQQREQQEAIAQEQMAQALGQANAAKPQQQAPMPDQAMPDMPPEVGAPVPA